MSFPSFPLAMLGMQFSLNLDERVATTLSSMIDDDQLSKNLKAATSSYQDPELMEQLKAIFDDLPLSQWETLETDKYWKKMQEMGWKQNRDN